MGARPDRDGKDAVQVHMTNTSNLPVEAIEMEYPLLVEEYGLVPDSGGAGRRRGGLGLRRVVRPIGHDCTFNGLGERFRHEPWGLAGGGTGARGRFAILGDNGAERTLGDKSGDIPIRSDERVVIETPGAGGARASGEAGGGRPGRGSTEREVQRRVPRPPLPLTARRRRPLTSSAPGSSRSPGSPPRRGPAPRRSGSPDSAARR